MAKSDSSGHADRAWAVFLACHAAAAPAVAYGYTSGKIQSPAWDSGGRDDCDDFDDNARFRQGAY